MTARRLFLHPCHRVDSPDGQHVVSDIAGEPYDRMTSLVDKLDKNISRTLSIA